MSNQQPPANPPVPQQPRHGAGPWQPQSPQPYPPHGQPPFGQSAGSANVIPPPSGGRQSQQPTVANPTAAPTRPQGGQLPPQPPHGFAAQQQPFHPGFAAGQVAAPPSRPIWKRWWFWVAAVVAVIILSSMANGFARGLAAGASGDAEPAALPAATASIQPEPTAPAADTPTAEPETPVETAAEEPSAPAGVSPAANAYGLPYPAAQAAFLDRIATASEAYDAATTELQRSQVIQQRNVDLCSIVPDGQFTDWVGMATTIGATGDGNAHIDVEIASDVVVGTWNNQLSDIGDNTLIPPGSALFDTLVGMDEDALVVFSGQFLSNDGACVYTSNLTEMFDAWSPDFVTHVSAVRPQ